VQGEVTRAWPAAGAGAGAAEVPRETVRGDSDQYLYEERNRDREGDSHAATTAQTTDVENFIVIYMCVTNMEED
jgi:hypothetical protein